MTLPYESATSGTAGDRGAEGVKERPILFSAPMVRALLAGTKTQTRRPVKRMALEWLESCGFAPEYVALPENDLCPYGYGRMWVRETWAAPHAYDHLTPRLIPQDARLHFSANEHRGGLLWRPSIHMPRWASRITLEITGVRVERLQEISEADAVAEGVRPDPGGRQDDDAAGFYRIGPVRGDSFPIARYAVLWESINGPGSWDANPWVWVVGFRRL